MQKRPLVSLLAGLALIIGLATGCANTGNTAAALGRPCVEVRKDLKQAKANKTERDGTPDEQAAAEAVKKLESELKSCNDGSSTTTNTTQPPDDGQAGVVDSDGARVSLPLVDDNGTIIQGDSTSDPRTPASYAMAKSKGPLVTWADAERVLGALPWYVDAVNARKGKTGFDWADIQKWATAKDVDPRVIQVFNLEISDQAARDAVRKLVGDSADRLPIARHQTCIINTRGFGHETVQDFADCRKMIRVSLAPIVYNEKGEPVGLRGNTGIFVDCFNIWWLPRQVVKHGPPPSVAPPATTTTPGTIPPGTVPPTTRPPRTTTTTTPGQTTTTTPGTTTSTTRPGGKNHEESPVTDNPNDPNEPVRPNTPEPTRPPATSTSTTQPRMPPPTTVAPPAPAPTTTAPAPPPTVGCQDPYGTGVCDP